MQWWKYRDSSLYYSLKSIKKEKRIPHVIEDSAVPLENLSKLFSVLNKINKKYKTRSIVYGHAGNGNIHVRLISDRKKRSIIKNIAIQYFKETIKLGGNYNWRTWGRSCTLRICQNAIRKQKLSNIQRNQEIL